MAQIEVDSKKAIIAVTVLVIIIVVVFLFGRQKGKDEKEVKEVDVSVNIKDQNGNTIAYNPNPLLERLRKGLTTRYYFDFSERCDPVKELYALDAARFMATVRAYKTKYNEELETNMKACWVNCKTGTGSNYFDLVYQKIAALNDVVK